MKKSILITVYDLEIGGIERSLINMLESFDYDNYDVDLLIFEHKGDLLNSIPSKVNILPEIKKLTIFRKPVKQCMKEGNLLLGLTRMLSKYMAIPKAKNRQLKEGSGYIQMQLTLKYAMPFLSKLKKKYDIAISYAWPHDFVTKKVKANKKIAWIHTDYTNLEIDNNLDFNVWDQFDHIASISEEVTESFLMVYPKLQEKIIQIENITSPQFIKEMASKSNNVYDEKTIFKIVSVGRLSYAKGFDKAIQALRILHDKGFSNFKWYVVGYGPEDANLKALITKNMLDDNFILLGKKSNPYPFIDQADIYVQPSRYEGKAVTVTEAKILNKPILLAGYPTARSQLEDGIEGLIAGTDTESLVDQIELLYTDESLRETLTKNLSLRNFNNSDELQKLYKVFHSPPSLQKTKVLKDSVKYEY